MSKVEELIKKYCLDGVEFRALGEVAVMKRGTSITKKNVREGSYPVISGGKEPAYYCDMFNREAETITVAGSGAGAGYVQYWTTPIFVCDAFSVKGTDKVLTKYLYYFLTNMQETIYSVKKGGGIPHVHISDIEDFLVPLPPLPVQEEIVRILDTFTELEKELEKELELRRKQYEYYRDLLLDFGHGDGGAYSVPWLSEMLHELCPQGVEYRKLGELLIIKNGKDYKQFSKGNIPVYGSGGIITYIDKPAYKKPSVLIPRKGSLSNLYFVTEPFWTVDTIFYTDINTSLVEPKYVFYCLQKEHLEKLNKAGGVPSLTQNVLNEITIPLPPLAIQRRIAAILDRFDVLCNDLTSGLPAEIVLRRKQYEYYRDKLLTFKELEKA